MKKLNSKDIQQTYSQYINDILHITKQNEDESEKVIKISQVITNILEQQSYDISNSHVCANCGAHAERFGPSDEPLCEECYKQSYSYLQNK